MHPRRPLVFRIERQHLQGVFVYKWDKQEEDFGARKISSQQSPFHAPWQLFLSLDQLTNRILVLPPHQPEEVSGVNPMTDDDDAKKREAQRK